MTSAFYCDHCGSIHGFITHRSQVERDRLQACLNHTCPDRPFRRWLRIQLGRIGIRGFRRWYEIRQVQVWR